MGRLRTCRSCRRSKRILLFATYNDRQGNQRRRGICIRCRHRQVERWHADHRAHTAAWRKRFNKKNRTVKKERDRLRRAEVRAYVDAIKLKTPCKDCGRKWKDPVAMDFDHVRGRKHRGVAQLTSGAYRLELVKIEIAKCEVVCACCHRIRTYGRSAKKKHRARSYPRMGM